MATSLILSAISESEVLMQVEVKGLWGKVSKYRFEIVIFPGL